MKKPKNIGIRLFKGTLLLSAARAIVNVLSALSIFILAWYLAPADFGLVALGTSLLFIASTVTQLSLSEALVRHEAPLTSHLNTAWTLNALRGVLLSILFALIAFPIAKLYEEPRLPAVMAGLSLSLVISGFENPRMVMMRRALVFRQDFIVTVSQRMAGFLVSVLIAVIFRSYWALVAGMVMTQLAAVVTSYLVVPFRPRVTFMHTRELLSFSSWLTAGSIVNTLNWRFDFLLAGKVLGTDGLGIYSVGNNLARLPTRETTMPLTQTIYPGLAAVGQDIQKLAAAYQRVQSLVTAVALPAGVGVAVIADPLVRLVLGEKWLAVIPVIQGLASIFALQTLGSQVRAVALTKGVPRLLLIQDVQVLIVRLPIVTIGLLMYGLPGLVWARVITGLIELFINLLLIRKLIELPIIAQLSANGRTFLSVAAMAIGVMLISWYVPNADGRADLLVQILLQIGFGILLYGGAIVLLWCVAKRPPGLERDAIMLAHNLIGSRLGANTE